MKKKLFIVSNRLPLTVEQAEDKYICRQSSGGLISSISSYLQGLEHNDYSEKIWVGAPGCNETIWASVSNDLNEDEYTYSPVFINWKNYELYYNGFSNSLLWPLFHYFPSYAEYNETYFDAYIEVNKLFNVLISKQINKDDIVWIHDYHLLPLAGMLRKEFPTLTIGFFLHIPFPSYELFRVIPKHWQREILTGMLGADLIGFHTLDYVEHFNECVSRILRTEHEGHFISWNNRLVKTDAFPISIDFILFNNAYTKKGVAEIRNKYIDLKGNKKLIFSIDRLDYTKGLSNRLKGYEQFLNENPEYKENVIFALAIIPSRDGITKYAERKRLLDEHIGNLNSRLGNISWQPVLYYYNHLSFEELVGLYTACDLALITPIRDGMNLVAKEFVASRQDKQGVLILSEMAGSAKELTEALLINPNDASEIAEMIKYGLEMNSAEQSDRLTEMRSKVQNYTVNMWASDFFRQLNDVKNEQLEFEVKFVDKGLRLQIFDQYATSLKRLFLLDYDGSLVPFSKHPSLAKPSDELKKTLATLGSNSQNDVFIISGRDSKSLEEWFGNLPINLIAEHGAKLKLIGREWETDTELDTFDWVVKAERIMQQYLVKCPNSFIERKEFSIAWHYRNSDPLQGNTRASELQQDLHKKMNAHPVNILNGHKIIEVRNRSINKGYVTEKILSDNMYDFIFSIGDDETDEDMFAKLARLPQSVTIKIGSEPSFAKYNLHTPFIAQEILNLIAEHDNEIVN
ncbi:MAG: bifunctional alpha,alpha-trehalose-phosphate synthase (UDP-forming)/trehalose-phosphatase [Bacteroidetes bacterium]|nr:bifunctional alpha,alpha-trehalose-phosphate synthase (UDP-forming)/trehalose-phosphatase [Bacteroidota bacterium]